MFVKATEMIFYQSIVTLTSIEVISQEFYALLEEAVEDTVHSSLYLAGYSLEPPFYKYLQRMF